MYTRAGRRRLRSNIVTMVKLSAHTRAVIERIWPFSIWLSYRPVKSLSTATYIHLAATTFQPKLRYSSNFSTPYLFATSFFIVPRDFYFTLAAAPENIQQSCLVESRWPVLRRMLTKGWSAKIYPLLNAISIMVENRYIVKEIGHGDRFWPQK